MTYEDTLSFLYSQLPMYQRQGKSAFKKDLTNINLLMEGLAFPYIQYKTIHIGGTNGKGTVSHIMAYGLQTQGYKVGLYTSPHYRDFRERIKVDGKLMEKQFVIDFVENNSKLIDEVKPSFFEITVAMAFQYFAEQNVDYAVIEVGLGGRLDSTNVITPELSIITNISYDHMDMLGDTLPKIAGEKAGIIKPDIPILIGERQHEVEEVFTSTAQQRGADLYWSEELVEVTIERDKYKVILDDHLLVLPTEPLLGEFQVYNLRTALAGLHILKLIKDWDAFIEGFHDFRSRVHYIGRWQMLSKSPDILVDSAHNEAGIGYLSRYIQQQEQYARVHIVCGFANDKDLSKILPLFPKEAHYYFAKANVPRGMDAQQLKEVAAAYWLVGESYPSVESALSSAKDVASESDLIFVGGSIFIVAEVV